MADKGEGTSRGSTIFTIVNDAKDSCDGGMIESDNPSEQSQATMRQSVSDSLTTSPSKASYSDLLRGNREEREPGSKKFGGKLWRQLDDSSDEEKPVTSHFENAKKSEVDAVDGSEDKTSLGKTNLVTASENAAPSITQNETSASVGDGQLNSSLQTEIKNSGLETEAHEEDHVNNLTPGTSSTVSQTEMLDRSVQGGSMDNITDGEGNLVMDISHETSQLMSKSVADPVGETGNDGFKVVPDDLGDEGNKSVSENQAKDSDMTAPELDNKPAEVQQQAVTQKEEKQDKAVDSMSSHPTAPRKIYGKFEYVPTREHIFRCLIPKCSQSFDTRLAAELHNLVHPDDENSNHLKCPNCDFTAPFYHWFDLLRHMRRSHQMYMSKEPFSCKYCGLVFENEESLSSHIDFHYSNRYKCIHCGLLLLTWGQVKRHLENCVDKHKGNLNLGCPYCTFVFHKKNIRNLHLLSHSDVGLACALCQDNAAWADWKTLRKHYQNRHAKTLQGRIAPFRHKLPKKRKPPRCRRCELEFKSQEPYAAHMMRVHDLVPYTLVECTRCGHKFRTERSHDWHVKHVHVEEITCEKCDFVATSKSVMKAHVAQKHGDKQHTCSECDKSFAYFHQLKVHLAHHARRTIYPCQKCDQEFSRQSDLKQHLISDHADPSDKAPQTCPECDYRCFSRAMLNTHIKKNHPELLEDDNVVGAAAAAAEEEEDSADHCYFTKKADGQPAAAEPQKMRRVGRRKGRQRKVVKYEWDRVKRLDGYSTIEDRRERRRLNRLMKEQDDRMKKLKKSTCARTRSYNEHQVMKNGGKMMTAVDRQQQLQDRHLHQSRVARAGGDEDNLGAAESTGVGIYGTQPYLDHSYFKVENSVAWNPELRAKMRMPLVLQSRGADGSVVDTPDVSAFQECETQMLGLGNIPPVRKRGRPPNSTLNRPILDARRRFTSVLESVTSGIMQSSNYQTLRLTPRSAPSTSTAKATATTATAEDDGLENLSAEIPDFELITESELLKNLDGYNIIDELLGMAQGSGNSFQPENSVKKVHHNDVPAAAGAKFSFHPQRVAHESGGVIENAFSDGLVIDNEAALSADFDDIELGEDVYSLFLGSSSAPVQSGNGGSTEESGKGAVAISGATAVSQNDILSLASFSGSSIHLSHSPSHRGLISPRRGNAHQGRNLTSLSPGYRGSSSASAAAGSSNAGFNSSVIQSMPFGQMSSSSSSSEISSQGIAFTLASSSHGLLPSDAQQNYLPANGGEAATSSAYATTDGTSRWKEPYLDTSGLLSLSEAANLCQQSACHGGDGLVSLGKQLDSSSASCPNTDTACLEVTDVNKCKPSAESNALCMSESNATGLVTTESPDCVQSRQHEENSQPQGSLDIGRTLPESKDQKPDVVDGQTDISVSSCQVDQSSTETTALNSVTDNGVQR